MKNIFAVGTVEQLTQLNEHFNVFTMQSNDPHENFQLIEQCESFVMCGDSWRDDHVSLLAGWAYGHDENMCYVLNPDTSQGDGYISIFPSFDNMEELIQELRG